MNAAKLNLLPSPDSSTPGQASTYVLVGPSLAEKKLAEVDKYAQPEDLDLKLGYVASAALEARDDDTGEIPTVLAEATRDVADELVDRWPADARTYLAAVNLGMAAGVLAEVGDEVADQNEIEKLLKAAKETINEHPALAKVDPALADAINNSIANGSPFLPQLEESKSRHSSTGVKLN